MSLMVGGAPFAASDFSGGPPLELFPGVGFFGSFFPYHPHIQRNRRRPALQ